MELSTQELLEYLNHMLSNGWSLNKLNTQKGIRRQTVRDKLKKEGYVLDQEANQFVKSPEVDGADKLDLVGVFVDSKPQKAKKKAPATNSLEDLEKRIEVLEMRLNAMETQVPSDLKVDVIKFESKTHDRNYPLHQEVLCLLDDLKRTNTHLKVKDLVNTALYIGLSKMKDSGSID